VLIPAVSRGVWRSLVILLRSCGMLPVSGPILRPRPLGCPVALIVGGVAFFFCSPMLYYSQYKLADAMCEWVHCMSLYCLRHPPSPRAWRRLLLVAMLFTVGWLGCVFSCLHWVLNSPVYAESGKSRTLFRVATGIYPVVLEIYLLLFLGPVALTTVLTADLGHELDLGPSQVIFHQDETPLDRVLHDLACTANSHVSAMILAFVVLHFYHSAFACSHTIISAINEPNLRWKLAVPVLHIICRNILFILLCWVAQRANSEHTRLSERVQTYLAKSSCTPTAGRREMEFLGFNVRTRRKRFNILGLFFLDLTFLKTVFGAILTYIVVLYQFGASFSSNKSE
ncbi:Gustatory receptor 89, partial [Frankliniella occidentalis]